MGTARRIRTQILGRRLLPLETTPVGPPPFFLPSFRKDLVLFFLSWAVCSALRLLDAA
jgi:hypothetical protein